MRKYEETHPFIDFSLDLRRLQARPDFWMQMGEAMSKLDHINSVPLLPATQDQLARIYLVKGAAATTAIEGNTLSEEEVGQLVEGQLKLPESREYQKTEVENIVAALEAIIAEVVEGSVPALTVARIKAFNGQVLAELPNADWVTPGEFTQRQVGVGGYRGAPPEDCEYLMERLAEWLNGADFEAQDPVLEFPLLLIRAIVAHLYIAWIHPFGDGNGRTARLVEYQLLLETGIVSIAAAHVLSNYYNQTRHPKYYAELSASSASDEGELSFIMYALEGFVEGLRDQLRFINTQVLEITWRDFIHDYFRDQEKESQQRLKHVLLDMEGPVDKDRLCDLSPRVARHYARMSKKTAARDLKQLLEKGLVVGEGDSISPNIGLLRAFLPPRVPRSDPASLRLF